MIPFPVHAIVIQHTIYLAKVASLNQFLKNLLNVIPLVYLEHYIQLFPFQ